MKRLLIVLAICLLAASQAQGSVFNATTGHWYELVSSGSSGAWSDAENSAVGWGGHLVSINDAAEETWLRTTFGSSTRYWIGFNDAAVEGTWVWSSGQPVTYTNWDDGQPDNAMPPPIGEDYAVINWNSTTGGWNDWDIQRGGYTYTLGIGEFATDPVPGSTRVYGTNTVYFAGQTEASLLAAQDAGNPPYFNLDLDSATYNTLPSVIDVSGLGSLISISASGAWGHTPFPAEWTGPDGYGGGSDTRGEYGQFGISP